MFKQRPLTPGFAVAAGCIFLILLGTLPVLFSFPPSPSLDILSKTPVLKFTGQILELLLVFGIILLIGKLDDEPISRKIFLYGSFLLLALILTNLHYDTVDAVRINWQADQYVNILAGKEAVPHQYRFLPQGILWWLFLLNGDFIIAYCTYRLFFTFLICLSLYKLSRIYNPHKDSFIVVLLYAVFYPLSIRHYYGNLLDPMFHFIFISALFYCQRRKMPELFLLLTAGMFVKETIILVIPCYYLLNMESPGFVRKKTFLKLSLLAVWCLLIFLACRIPFGFRFNFEEINGITKLMILSNLGISNGPVQSFMPVWIRYFHPMLFIFIWIPALIFYRKILSSSLFYTTLYLAVSIYLTNLCFGWNYESRNFIPALCMILISMARIFNQKNVLRVEVSGNAP